MEKKKRKKLPEIGMFSYLTLDELFESLYEYIKDNVESDDDYDKFAEYLWRLGEDGVWELETAYFKLISEKIKDDYPKSYKKLMDFIKEFESEDCAMDENDEI